MIERMQAVNLRILPSPPESARRYTCDQPLYDRFCAWPYPALVSGIVAALSLWLGNEFIILAAVAGYASIANFIAPRF